MKKLGIFFIFIILLFPQISVKASRSKDLDFHNSIKNNYDYYQIIYNDQKYQDLTKDVNNNLCIVIGSLNKKLYLSIYYEHNYNNNLSILLTRNKRQYLLPITNGDNIFYQLNYQYNKKYHIQIVSTNSMQPYKTIEIATFLDYEHFINYDNIEKGANHNNFQPVTKISKYRIDNNKMLYYILGICGLIVLELIFIIIFKKKKVTNQQNIKNQHTSNQQSYTIVLDRDRYEYLEEQENQNQEED